MYKVPDDAVAGPAERRAAAGGESLRPLSHAPRHRCEGGGGWCGGGRAWSCRCGGGGVGVVCRWRRGALGQLLHLHGGGHLTGVKLVCEVGVGHPGGSVRGGGGRGGLGGRSSGGARLSSRGWS